MYDEILVRYGELSTKGKNRKYFIEQLQHNVRQVLTPWPEVKIKAQRDHMYLILNGAPEEEIGARLQNIFGIQSYSPVMKVAKTTEAMVAGALKMMQATYQPGQTFKIVTKRADHQFELDTNGVNQLVGEEIFKALDYAKVAMKNPDMVLRIEVRMDYIYLTNQVIKCAGGLPVGTSGKGMLMLSGGIDSPVAGYLAMKRGIKVEAVHFASPPYTSPQSLNKAKELAAKIAKYSGLVNFIEVPFTKIQEEIKNNVPEGYWMTLTRRMMLRLADLIRAERKGLAIINGESLGQVASQTMDSMYAINEVTTTPIIRPVVTMDKTEIIKIAEEIDTFDLAIQPFEDCCTVFAPKAPKTKPKMEKVLQYEERLNIDALLQEALAGITITPIKPGDQFLLQAEEEISSLL